MLYDLIPKRGVGGILLNEDISKYLFRYNFKFCKSKDATSWDEYDSSAIGMLLYTEKDKIQAISCDKSLIYKGVDVIGLELLEFINAFDLEIDEAPERIDISEDEFQYLYEFEELGLQVWCENSVIVTVIVS